MSEEFIYYDPQYEDESSIDGNNNNKLTLSKNGIADIISYEGMTPTPYLDDYPGGTWTIGVGITDADGIDVKSYFDSPLSIQQMVDQFKLHVARYERRVNQVIHVELSQNEFDALVSFHYNTGAINRLAEHINNEESSEEILAHLQSYNRGNGHIMDGLVERRQKESNMYLYGKYGNGKVEYIEANREGKLLHHTAKEINILKYL